MYIGASAVQATRSLLFLSVGAFAGLFSLQAVARALLAGQAQLAHPAWAMTLMALAGSQPSWWSAFKSFECRRARVNKTH
jgi:hypothetical protein